MKEIIALFRVDGSVEVEANGYKGKGCASSTKFLRDALGSEVLESKKTEFHYEDEKENRKVVSQCNN